MKHAFSLENETALITGGGSGLGLGIARCLVAAGAKVVLVGRRVEVLEDAAKELGASAFAMSNDVTWTDRAAEGIARAAELADSPVSILINNAGVHLKKPAAETAPEEFEKVMRTHVTAAQALSAAVIPGMLERGHGNLLFTASMTALIGMPNVVAYSAAKSALGGMVRALSSELASGGIRVNGIAPGWIRSEMLDQALLADPARKARILQRTPMGRFGDPEDIGNAAVYLCSAAGRFVTGTVLPVDGGAVTGF